MLPHEPPARGVGVGQAGSFTTGAYSFDGEVGLRRNALDFPKTSHLLARHVATIAPSFPFTSVAIFQNLQTPCHCDRNNFPGSFNLVAPLSQFQNGHIWYENQEGDHLLSIDGEEVPGYLLPVAEHPVWLPASSARHCTMDWVGDRVVLVAFSIKEALELPHAVADHLKRLDFRCPTSAASLTLRQTLESHQSAPRGSAVSAPQNQHQETLAPFIIEICSGSGVLSAAFRDVGFRTLAVDRPGNDHRLAHSYVPLDLADPGNQDLLMKSLEDALRIGHLHLGVPCGTCSRARERALPVKLRARHAAPRPLRDARHPLGKPGLTGADKIRVKTANELYKFALRIVLWAFQHDVPVTIENPARSWLWPALDCLVKKMRPIFGHDLRRAWTSLKFYDLDACMFGGKRKKRTRLASSADLSQLAVSCDNSHPHLPWAIREVDAQLAFDTAEEAQYPRGLCMALAHTFVAKFERSGGLLRPPGDFSPTRTGSARHQRPLVPQFRATLVAPQVPPGEQFKLLVYPTGDIPQANEHTGSTGDLKTFGVRWTPQEFLQQAKGVEHPMNPEQALSDLLKDVIFANLTTPPVELAKSRIQAVVTVRQMAADLESKEQAFKEKMDPLVAKILKPKRILLWKSLLLAANYDDMEIVDLVAKGIPLTGSHGSVPALPEKLVPATDSMESLLAASELRRKALTSSGKVTSDKEQEDLTEASNEEVRRGELEGPFSEEEVTRHFGSKEWLLNPRFALYQGVKMKLRVIDDAKRSGLNEAFQRTCAATLMDLDAVTCLLATIAKAMVDGKFQGVDVDDQVKAEHWLGRTLDLSRAYKQLPIDPDSRKVCVLGFLKQGKWVYYRCNVLPFGARASVFSFLRVSRSLHFIMAKYLQALNTVFFDDFPMVSTSGGSKILQRAASTVLNLLGWAHAEEGEKAPGFQSDFVALGVQVVLKDIGQGRFEVQNKPGRVEKLVAMIEEAASKPDVAKALPELQGHLNFASGFFFNKGLRFLAKALNKASANPGSEVFQGLCRAAISLLKATPPRTLDLGILGPPLLVFTDGAWEAGHAGAGAVIHCCATGATLACEIPVPQDLIATWIREAGEQIICQIEMWAFLALRVTMGNIFTAVPTVAWIDNEAARYALMKGSADSASLRKMARLNQHADLKAPSMIWYERVASFSNPADAPSRGGLHKACLELGAEPFVLPDVSDLVKDVLRLSRQPWADL